MHATEGSAEDAPADSAPRGQSRFLHRRQIVGICVVVSLVLLGWGGYFWLTHDRSLREVGWGTGGPTPVGHTFYVGLAAVTNASGPDGSAPLNLRRVTPRISTNTADATVNVLICEAAGASSGLLGGGTVRDDISTYCTSVRPFSPGTVNLGLRASGLVVGITPNQPGEVYIEGFDISYRHGIRQGQRHQHISITVEGK